MFTSLPPRRLRWSAGAAGRSSPNRVPAPHSRNVTSRIPQNFGVRVALPGRRQICEPSFSLDSLRLERPDAYGPGLLRAGTSGEERCTPHHMVIISPQYQSCQCSRAQRSPASASLSLPPRRNVVELGGSPPLRGSLEQLDRSSPVDPSLQGT